MVLPVKEMTVTARCEACNYMVTNITRREFDALAKDHYKQTSHMGWLVTIGLEIK